MEILSPFAIKIPLSKVSPYSYDNFIPNANLIKNDNIHHQINEETSDLVPDLDVQDKLSETKGKVSGNYNKSFV